MSFEGVSGQSHPAVFIFQLDLIATVLPINAQ